MLRSQLSRATLVVALLVTASVSHADIIAQYDLTGKTGSEVSDPTTFTATGVTGMSLSRGSGLTASAASNGFAAIGWNDLSANDFFRFGVTVNPGQVLSLTELLIATRSSATGPGFINVDYSADGGPEQLLTTLSQPNAQYLDLDLTFAAITAKTSLVFFLRSVNATAANGGAIAAGGTFRVSNYGPDGANFQPISLLGTLTPTSVVPEPASMILLGLGTFACGICTRIRRRDKVSIYRV